MRFGHGRVARLFSSGQETEIVTRCENIEEALNLLPDSELKAECRHWLGLTRRAIQHWPIAYAEFDAAWVALHEIRHRFCRMLPTDELMRIALDVRDDLAYVHNAAERKKHLTLIDAIVTALSTSPGATEIGPDPSDRLRDGLQYLSLLGADVREARWHKVNVLRSRLLDTAVCMFVVEAALVAMMTIWPHSFGIGTARGPEQVSRYAVLGVAAFGSLGGLLSALTRHEQLTGSSAAFYVERTALILRPVIGVAAGLVTYLLLLAGLVTIGPPAAFPYAYFVAAFAAGFSERLFLGQLNKALGETDDAAKASTPAKEADC